VRYGKPVSLVDWTGQSARSRRGPFELVTELASNNSNGVPAIPPIFDVGVCAPIARRTDVFDTHRMPCLSGPTAGRDHHSSRLNRASL